MIKKVQRYFLDLQFKKYKILNLKLPKNIKIVLNKERDFNINKFFYKNIGIDHYWRDRLIWTDKEWIKYVSNPSFETWIIKQDEDLVGFYEQEFHVSANEIELIQMGILKEYQGKKFGSFLLNYIIHKAFVKNVERVWVHTCSLDHKHALDNYLSKGFKTFKEETINFVF